MADVTIDATVSTALGVFCPRGLVWTSATVAYAFYVDSTSGDVSYSKTSDGGQTWGAPVAAIVLGTGPCCFDIWFDKWTPGGTGTTVHILALDTAADDVLYRGFNTSNDTFVAATVVAFAGSTAVAGEAMQITITKSASGNLFALGTIDDGTEDFFRRSANEGVTWANMGGTNWAIDADDKVLAFPVETSGDDILVLHYDASANDMLARALNDNTTWHGPTTIDAAAVITSAGVHPYFNGATRHSDGHVIETHWNALDVSTADLLCNDISYNGSTITVTAKTTINTNSDDCILCCVTIDQLTDDIYVGYCGKADGSEAWVSGQGINSNLGVSYKKSTDDAGSWGSEVLLFETRTYYFTWMQGCPSISVGRMTFTAFEADNADLMTNYVNSVLIAALPTITDVETDEAVENRDRDVTITGTNFLASQGDGTVELADNAVYASATNIVPQVVQSWSATAIDFIANLHIGSAADELAPGTVYVFVKNSAEDRNTTGFAITVSDDTALKYVAGGSQAGGAGGNGYTIPIPDGTWLGDLLICAWIKQVTDVPSVDGFADEGWTRFPGSPFEQTNGGFKYEVDIAWKIQTTEIEDNPSFNWSASSDSNSHVLVAYANTFEADPVVQLVAEIETTQNDQPVHPGITIERTGSGLIYIYATNVDATASAPPTGFVERLDDTTLLSAGDDLTTTPGATGSITGSLVDPEWPSMFLIEIATEAAAAAAVPKPTLVGAAVHRSNNW